MAHVYLKLRISGTDIEGEYSDQSLGLEDWIECISFHSGVTTSAEASTGLSTRRREYAPIVIQKRIDKSTPLLLKALTDNETIEAIFWFLRSAAQPAGTAEHYYTVRIANGRITSIKQASEGDPPALADLEDVAFSFNRITWTHEIEHIEHQDDLRRTGRTTTGISSATPTGSSTGFVAGDSGDTVGKIRPQFSASLAEIVTINRSFLRIAELAQVAQTEDLDELDRMANDPGIGTEEVNLKLQQSQEKSNRLMQMISNILKVQHDTMKTIIQNMR